MKRRLALIAAKRQRLVERIESQRMEVGALAQRWQMPLALADLGLRVLRLFREHPVLASGGAAALLTLRRKGIVAMLREWRHLLSFDDSPLSFIFKIFSRATHAPGNERNARADH
ncbi:MAG TPA: YqjK family protein [Gallionellaceae bacterium]